MHELGDPGPSQFLHFVELSLAFSVASPLPCVVHLQPFAPWFGVFGDPLRRTSPRQFECQLSWTVVPRFFSVVPVCVLLHHVSFSPRPLSVFSLVPFFEDFPLFFVPGLNMR